MGDPKRLRRKYETPSSPWNLDRISREHKLVETYGPKNRRELWRATTIVKNVRRNVRIILSGKLHEEIGKQIIDRLARYNIVEPNSTLDALLVIKPEQILERRLQTLVYRKGLARTIKQARQLITHGFISVDGRKITSPGYLVTKEEENSISYYKPIKIQIQSTEINEEKAQGENNG